MCLPSSFVQNGEVTIAVCLHKVTVVFGCLCHCQFNLDTLFLFPFVCCIAQVPVGLSSALGYLHLGQMAKVKVPAHLMTQGAADDSGRQHRCTVQALMHSMPGLVLGTPTYGSQKGVMQSSDSL